MSADEDSELRDLVAQTLEANGVLGKIRAQLRASVFLALEEQESIQSKTPFANAELKKFIHTKDGRLAAGLVREFLEHFNMEFTLAVFDPESNLDDQYGGREALARDLNIAETTDSAKQPLLMQVLRQGAHTDGARQRSDVADGSRIVDNKNKHNINKRSDDMKHLQKHTNSFFKDDDDDDDDDDAFFDDPVPSNNNTKTFTSEKAKKEVRIEANADKRGGGGGLTSLAGLPSLTNSDSQSSPRTPDLHKDLRTMDKKLTDLGFDVHDDDYDDDFDSSNVSPFGVSPRSARSDRKLKSLDDELDEEIEEEISGGDDFLKSDNSGMDDLTTDRTVSPDHHSTAIDYMEDVLLP